MVSPAQHARSASVAPRPPCPWPWRRLPARRRAGASSPAALPPLPAQVPLAGAARTARPGPWPRPGPGPLGPSRAALGQLLPRTPTLPWAALSAPPRLSTGGRAAVLLRPRGFSSFGGEGRAGQRGEETPESGASRGGRPPPGLLRLDRRLRVARGTRGRAGDRPPEGCSWAPSWKAEEGRPGSGAVAEIGRAHV